MKTHPYLALYGIHESLNPRADSPSSINPPSNPKTSLTQNLKPIKTQNPIQKLDQ